MVPEEAIVRINTLPYIMMQINEETFQLKRVKTGAIQRNLVEILSGIDGDDSIVLTGGLDIYNETAGSVDPHAGHKH